MSDSIPNWVEVYHSSDGSTAMKHVDGVDWTDAPKHRLRCFFGLHRPQTRGWVNFFDYVARCSCGAIQVSYQGKKGWVR